MRRLRYENVLTLSVTALRRHSLRSLGGLPRGRRDAIGDHSKNPVEIILAHELGFKGEGVAHALPMPVDENQRLMAVHQHRVEFVMGVFDLVRHRRMSGQEGTEKPWHPVGWTQNHILSNPLHAVGGFWRIVAPIHNLVLSVKSEAVQS